MATYEPRGTTQASPSSIGNVDSKPMPEIISVHLLVVLVAAAYLARAKRRKTPRPVEMVASVEPPVSVAEHAAIGREAPAGVPARSGSVLVGGGS